MTPSPLALCQGKENNPKKKFFFSMEILELETIISLLSFSFSKIRWKVTFRIQRHSPSCSSSPTPLAHTALWWSSVFELLLLCPACPCGPLSPAYSPPHPPYSLPLQARLTLELLCLDRPFGAPCSARSHSPKGDTCTLQRSPLCPCWVNTCRIEFQRIHMVTKYLFHFVFQLQRE